MKSLFAVLGILLFSFALANPKVAPADLVFINGNVYTVNAKQPQAQAIAIRADRIVFVGSNAAARQYQSGSTRVVDLHGATVVPGMTDAHYHFIGVGQREMNLNLEGINNLEDFLARIKTRVDQAKHEVTLLGPRGRSVDVKIENPENMKIVKKGDLVEVTYTEAIAISVDKTGK